MIKKTKDGLITPLFHKYSKSLCEGTLPVSWKDAIIIPVYKNESMKTPSNYRPISLTSVFCRMLESIIKDKMMAYFKFSILIICFLNSNTVFILECHNYYMQLITGLGLWIMEMMLTLFISIFARHSIVFHTSAYYIS